MEQNMSTGASEVPVTYDKQKSGNGLKIATAIACIVATCGVGFGVWAMMDGKAQKEQYDTQISGFKKQISELTEKLANGGAVSDAGTTATTTVDAEDYVYVGEWGVKFKISDNLQNVSYTVKDFGDGTSLCVSAATTGHGDTTPSFTMPNGDVSSLGCLSKYTKAVGEVMGIGEVTVGNYYYTGPQALVGDEADKAWEIESVEAIKNMLSTDNMSNI